MVLNNNTVKKTTRSSAYKVFQNNYDLPLGVTEVTEWSDGQGLDIEVRIGKNRKQVAFTYEEWASIKECAKALIKPESEI